MYHLFFLIIEQNGENITRICSIFFRFIYFTYPEVTDICFDSHLKKTETFAEYSVALFIKKDSD
jgi:hypothetical protein